MTSCVNVQKFHHLLSKCSSVLVSLIVYCESFDAQKSEWFLVKVCVRTASWCGLKKRTRGSSSFPLVSILPASASLRELGLQNVSQHNDPACPRLWRIRMAGQSPGLLNSWFCPGSALHPGCQLPCHPISPADFPFWG